MKVYFYKTRDTASFVRDQDVCQYGRVWLAMYKARTWREFIAALPEDYKDFFDERFEDDSDVDQPFDPDLVLSSYEGYFPPGLPDGLVRDWMPKEIIEKFGDAGYDRDVSFNAENADAILAILRREGYECIETPKLIEMMSFGLVDRNDHNSLAEIEQLLDATEKELAPCSKSHAQPRQEKIAWKS